MKKFAYTILGIVCLVLITLTIKANPVQPGCERRCISGYKCLPFHQTMGYGGERYCCDLFVPWDIHPGETCSQGGAGGEW
jgi:hypothetical protein